MNLVRLTSGEEIVGNVERWQDDSIYISDGYSVIKDGSDCGIRLEPFMPYTEASKGVNIPGMFAMFVVDAKPELVKLLKELK